MLEFDLERRWSASAGHLFDEVELGPLPSAEDYEQAFKAWLLPYYRIPPLDESDIIPSLRSSYDSPLEFLVSRIHYHLRTHPYTLPTPKANAQMPPNGQGWRYTAFLTRLPPAAPVEVRELRVNGQPLYQLRKFVLEEELAARRADTEGTRPILLARLRECMLQEANRLTVADNCKDLYPRSRLRRWFGPREDRFLVPFDPERFYKPFELYTMALHLSPYNPTYWIARAFLFFQQGHHDLALGDAYRALYLADTVFNVHSRAKQPGLYPRVCDAIAQHLTVFIRKSDLENVRHQLRKDQGVPYFTTALRVVSHHLIALSLAACRAVSEAPDIDSHLLARQIMSDADADVFGRRRTRLQAKRNAQRTAIQNLPAAYNWPFKRSGRVYVRPYPQEPEAPERTAFSFLQVLNDDFIKNWQRDSRKRATVEVDVQDHGQGLRMIAARKLRAGDLIYSDEPSVRGHLRCLGDEGRARQLSEFRTSPQQWTDRTVSCENCKRVLPLEEIKAARHRVNGAHQTDQARHDGKSTAVDALTDECACMFADPIIAFCQPYHSGRLRRRRQIDYTNQDGNGRPPKRRKTTTGGGRDNDANPGPTRGGRPRGRGDRGTICRGGGGGGGRGTGRGGRGGGDGGTGGDLPSSESPPPNRPRRTPRPPRGRPTTDRAVQDKRRAAAVSPGGRVRERPSCYQIARHVFHHCACGKKWRWLHEAMQSVSRDVPGEDDEHLSENWRFGTVLSLLLREVFDMTLIARQDDPRILAHEIDAMLPLSGEEDHAGQSFPFGWMSNIVVPFNILQCLGVNIFRDLSFDTWVTQLVLRKLMINAVPYRTVAGDPPWATSRDMYVHTVFGLFNHACADSQNAQWGWDHVVSRSDTRPEIERQPGESADAAAVRNSRRPRNRILVRATRTIAKGEEIRINYFRSQHGPEYIADRAKYIGRNCTCHGCVGSVESSPSPAPSADPSVSSPLPNVSEVGTPVTSPT